LDFLDIAIAQPPKDKHKSTRQNSKDVTAAHFTVQYIEPYIRYANINFIEVPVGSKGARAMFAYGYCCGIAGSMRAHNHSLIEVDAKQVKMAVTRDGNASKDSMIIECMKQYPHLPWPMKTAKGETTYVKGKAEHMADAIGAVKAGIKTKEFQDLLSMMG
jgi:hypothetical protein